MPQPALTPEQEAHFNDTRRPALWGCLITFLVINDVAIAGRLWGTWRSVASRSRVMAEDISIILSGIFVNVIIANLMVATHYGLGLHTYTINSRDPDYPSNLSKTFRHIWITMVLMCAFFVCIKMTLLFFYRRLFLVSNRGLHIFWWINFVYIILWFFCGTAFYLFQCKPVEWYFLQYYDRFHKPVPGGKHGQCNATSVLHVSLPVIFSLISDVGLLALPIWAISKLRLDKTKKRGLMVVFGIGLVAAMLELARILALIIDTDDKTDPSYGVAIFLILTATEETTAVVCACLPVIFPQVAREFRNHVRNNSYIYDGNRGQGSSEQQSSRGFKRVVSLNHIWTTVGASKMGTTHDDGITLHSVEVTGNSTLRNDERDGTSDHTQHPYYQMTNMGQPEHGYLSHPYNTNYVNQTAEPRVISQNNIHVRTDVQVHVDNEARARENM
ncbi:uncharacterized protein GGS22DRAFT_195771 [Annulohypoxylon maeteangense]|uniref:uncharacterized protein n=1 Tax=Annulohypoxylon maeteangense TaxID=1927788 RepID=UPI0020078B52|nr:uncharacterized protein GGS22DRAFT_195771 [Annulohypoxylon maeteangense]KAI0882499.1 hypothetical protein GGS22DRAFT_195771 [Annulohypoxylon maeteangense]